MDNTWQISPLRYMLLVGAFVLVGTNGYHEESFCVSSDNHMQNQGRRNTERCCCGREHRPSLLVPKKYFKEEGEVECHDMRLHDVLFKLLVDNGSAKKPPRPTHTPLVEPRAITMNTALAITTHLSSHIVHVPSTENTLPLSSQRRLSSFFDSW